MKIKSLGYTGVRLSFNNIDILVDPVASKETTGSFPKTPGDIVLFTSEKYLNKEDILSKAKLLDKIEPRIREDVLEIVNPGEYESGEVFIRRPMKQNFYVLDEGDIRIVVMGMDSKSIVPDKLKQLGDVDVLIVPGGDGEKFMSYDKLEKVIRVIDPTHLVPTAFAGEKVKIEGLKTSEEFIKHFGYTRVNEDSTLKITKGKEADTKTLTVTLLS